MPASASSTSSCPGGFNHYEQSLRIVDVLENDGAGPEPDVGSARRHRPPFERASTACRSARRRSIAPRTVEGQIARVADIIAYVNHDIDDAVRAGILSAADELPARSGRILGDSSSERIGTHGHATSSTRRSPAVSPKSG